MPLGVAFVQETTVFREFGPLAGNTMRLAYDYSPKIGSLLSRQTIEGDARHYLRLGGSGLLATRFRGFRSAGEYPRLPGTSAATASCAATTTSSSPARISSSPTPSSASR